MTESEVREIVKYIRSVKFIGENYETNSMQEIANTKLKHVEDYVVGMYVRSILTEPDKH